MGGTGWIGITALGLGALAILAWTLTRARSRWPLDLQGLRGGVAGGASDSGQTRGGRTAAWYLRLPYALEAPLARAGPTPTWSPWPPSG